jgi:hypothetical protein
MSLSVSDLLHNADTFRAAYPSWPHPEPEERPMSDYKPGDLVEFIPTGGSPYIVSGHDPANPGLLLLTATPDDHSTITHPVTMAVDPVHVRRLAPVGVADGAAAKPQSLPPLPQYTCGQCGMTFGTNFDEDKIECPECEARRCPHCKTWFGDADDEMAKED